MIISRIAPIGRDGINLKETSERADTEISTENNAAKTIDSPTRFEIKT